MSIYHSIRYSGRPKPYIGVTGITQEQHILDLTTTMRNYYLRDLMVGILVDSKSLTEGKTPKSKRFRDVNTISHLMGYYGTLNIVHYCNPGDQLADEIIQLIEKVGLVSGLHGFQINSKWPDIKQLKTLCKSYHPQRLIIQVSPKSDTFEVIIERLNEYVGIATDILIDGSLGRGQSIDKDEIQYYLELLIKIRDTFPGFGLGVAGGLSAETIWVVSTFAKEIPYLSIDAEGKLRAEDGELDLKKAKRYLLSAIEAFE